MRRSTEKILTTHVGALPGPEDVWGHEAVDDARVSAEVAKVVAFQRDAGIDLVNEGELTKGGTWVNYINRRIDGFESRDPAGQPVVFQGADREEFSEFYDAATERGTLFETTGASPPQGVRRPTRVCTGPIHYVGQDELKRDLDILKGALGDIDTGDAFMTSTAPASIEPGRVNEHYDSDEAFLFALADSLAVEYEIIAQSGVMLQVDDAWLAALWDRIGIPMGLAAYKRWAALRIEALNHALRNVPEDQVRYHLCWGSWHGPHAHDLPLPDIIDEVLKIKAQNFLIEAANVRHEHEISLWERVKLPAGKILAPGVVTHSTILIEHPELVSSRIQRVAALVGRENVIASTDCGLGLRCHPQIAWAKLKVLSEGAALATKALGY